MSLKLPFEVDRGAGSTLCTQLVDGFRRAIALGLYRPGGILPSFRQVAQETGVSLIVVREAFRRLASEGLASPQRGIGSVVLDRGAFAWRGHIVIASVELRENYLISGMTGALRQSLMKAGYMVSTVPFGTSPSKFDFSHLDSVLKTPVTLVVATSSSAAIDRHLAGTGSPFVSFGYSPSAVRCMRIDCSEALSSFATRCRKACVKQVTEVRVGSDIASPGKQLRAAGVACRVWTILRKGGIEEISRSVLDAFYSKIAKHGKAWLPDLFYFNDNFAAQSALLALSDSGISIPEDVGLVTWSNAGEGPFWRKDLDRIEIDPVEAGRLFADFVLSYLNGRKGRARATVSPHYVAGETLSCSSAGSRQMRLPRVSGMPSETAKPASAKRSITVRTPT